MTAYDRDVEKKLGKETWKLLIQYVNSGRISSQQSSDIARGLSEKIFGAHENRMKDSGWNNIELRHILANWYEEKMFDMTREEALSTLANIFEDTTLGLNCLASEIRKSVEKNKLNDRTESKRCVDDNEIANGDILNPFHHIQIVSSHDALTISYS